MKYTPKVVNIFEAGKFYMGSNYDGLKERKKKRKKKSDLVIHPFPILAAWSTSPSDKSEQNSL